MTEKKLLLVDDEADIRDVLEISLWDMGYSVLTAENGEKALDIFRDKHPSIVLVDIKMPGMDGIELLQKIKQEDPETEVIMITGHGDMDLAIQSFQDDAADFITKPVDVNVLDTALKRAQEKILIRSQLKAYTENLETLLLEKSKQLAAAGHRTEPRNGISPAPRPPLQHLLDRLPCYVLVQDEDLIITAANRRFQDDFGDEIGNRCYAVCRKRSEPCPDCPVLKTFGDGKSYQYEMEYILRSGDPTKVLAWTLPVQSSDGVVTQVMVMSTDVAQISELQDHLSSLGLMVGSLSHGIKGLLTGIDSGMYLLGTGLEKKNADRTQEGLELVRQTVGRLKKMVLDILFYAKDRELKRETIDVRAFADDIIDTVEAKITSRGIALRTEFQEPLGTFGIDTGYLLQALINILENAVDACTTDSTKPAHTIFFGVVPESEAVRFEIRDDGIGMDRETRERMFNLFFSSKGKAGTGLGLFITKKIVDQHGGSISVESEKGKGTRVRIRIPRTLP